VGDAGLAQLTTLRGLESLNLAGTRVEGHTLPDLGGWTQLRELDLERTPLRFESLSALTQLAALRSLTLPAGLTSVGAEPLGALAALESLSICDSQLDDAGLAFVERLSRLRRLQLNGAAIGDAGMTRLSGLVELRELNLTGTGVSDAGLAALRPLVRLERLSLNGTTVTLSGVVGLFVDGQGRTLVAALKALGLATVDERGDVVEIDVAGTDLGDAELRHLGPLPSLRTLHLAGTKVTDAGLAELGQLAETGGLAGLERLYLAKCNVTDAGLRHVARLPRLRALNLYGTKLTSAGLPLLEELHELRLLSVTDIRLKPAAVEQLQKKLPRLTISDYTPE
jgi:Leucine-rich repeat (LRR) protein